MQFTDPEDSGPRYQFRCVKIEEIPTRKSGVVVKSLRLISKVIRVTADPWTPLARTLRLQASAGLH
jgi:hypothetical protein